MNTPTSVKIKRQILMVICAAESCMLVVKLVFKTAMVWNIIPSLNPPKTQFGTFDALNANIR